MGPLMEALMFTGRVWGCWGVEGAGPDGWALAAALAALLGFHSCFIFLFRAGNGSSLLLVLGVMQQLFLVFLNPPHTSVRSSLLNASIFKVKNIFFASPHGVAACRILVP